MESPETTIAKVVTDAHRVLNASDYSGPAAAGAFLLKPSALVHAARHLLGRFAALHESLLTADGDDAVLAASALALRHAEHRLMPSTLSLWRICGTLQKSAPLDELAEFWARKAPSAREFLQGEKLKALSGKDLLEAALEAQDGLSASHALLQGPSYLLPSRLGRTELLERPWEGDATTVDPAVPRTVWFECALPLHRRDAPGLHDVIIRAAPEINSTLDGGLPPQLLLQGVTLHPRPSDTSPLATTAYIRTQISARESIDGPGAAVALPHVPGSIFAVLDTNLRAAIGEGVWTHEEGVLNLTRLTDRSAMTLGRAMAGTPRTASPFLGAV